MGVGVSGMPLKGGPWHGGASATGWDASGGGRLFDQQLQMREAEDQTGVSNQTPHLPAFAFGAYADLAVRGALFSVLQTHLIGHDNCSVMI